MLAFASLWLASAASAQTVNPALYSGMVWRNIGPFRGGRVSAVTGAVGEPGVFYIGLPLGGVWKTTGAGTTWVPIFDSIKTASCVGAIEVAPSDPNIIYVGMGDLITGGGIDEGNGVYKSTDAGKTWQHLGLDDTRQIPSILVDPHNPDLAMVAAQGNIHALSTMRGVYRTTDGGATWTRTLYVDNQTGVQKIAWAEDDPGVMLATTVHHYIAPPQPGRPPVFRGPFGGPQVGTHLFKSTDEGLTWHELTGGGLPKLGGRTCVAVAMHTNGQRMFLVGNFGLYRSDDGGTTWRQMDAADHRVANGQGGYNCGVYVNSADPNTVYVINTSSYVSRDGGETFTGFKGAPGGDDPQQMWIDPTNGKRMLLGMDQGATVSLDGGLTWSSWYNQPTSQIYHLSVNNAWPYWVFGTQQDTDAVSTASRGNFGEITPLDWLPHPGSEFGSIAADPLDPNISYASGGGGGVMKVINPSAQWFSIGPSLDPSLSLFGGRNQPMMFSPTNPHELMVGFQYLMATTDGGMHWFKLSGDLGHPKGYKPPAPGASPANRTPPGGNTRSDDAGSGQFFPGRGGAIDSFSPSSVDGKIIWAGTTNGLVKLTRDGGKTWTDVSIPDLPKQDPGDVTCIDASHQDPGEAYAAIDRQDIGDYTPWFYRTRDYGATWAKIVTGLPTDQPSGSFARFIRADTERKGLLFAGTESSVYVSFDDGDNWQSLMLNLPNTSYRDMVIHGNDLVTCTYGRGFWILDDISPLRQITASMADQSVVLFKPGNAVRVRRNVGNDTPFPPEVPHALNPPDGAIVYYWLGKPAAGLVTLDVTDADGNEIRHYSSAPITTKLPPPPEPDFWIKKPMPMPDVAGMTRMNWNLRYNSPPAFSHGYGINANPGLTPATPEGPMVLPGVYTLTLRANGKTETQTVTVTNDPRSPATAADLRALFAQQMAMYNGSKSAYNYYQQVADMETAVTSSVHGSTDKTVTDAATAFTKELQAIGGQAQFNFRFFGGFGRRGGGPQAPTFADVNRSMLRFLDMLGTGDLAPTEGMVMGCDAATASLANCLARWRAANGKDLTAFNAVLSAHNLPTVAAAILP